MKSQASQALDLISSSEAAGLINVAPARIRGLLHEKRITHHGYRLSKSGKVEALVDRSEVLRYRKQTPPIRKPTPERW